LACADLKKYLDKNLAFLCLFGLNAYAAFGFKLLKLHRVPKKEATKLLPITFSNLNRFLKFFHCWIEDEYFQQNCVIFSTTP